MIEQLQITNKWFTEGIPPAYITAPWQEPNSDKNTMRPDLTGKVNYRLNSLGYRDLEFSDNMLNNSIWCVGHSDVLGMGVDEPETWCRRLEELTGNQTVNLGIAGASYDTIARVITSGLKKYKPTLIIVQNTTMERKEYISEDFQQIVLPNFPKDMLPHNDVWKYSDNETAIYDYERNLNLIQSACKANNVRLIMFNIPDRWDLIKQFPAHDKEHIGPKVHEDIANYLIAQVTQAV